jgi:NAD(P)-dependent dehydrogenase (short-subunit alcohol dehydrogenase family)
MEDKSCLVFGGLGTIGAAVVNHFESKGYSVWMTSRSPDGAYGKVIKIIGGSEIDASVFGELPPLDVVVWAQGLNTNDSIENVQLEVMEEIIHGNATFIVETMNALILEKKILDGARLCIISSIWQEIVRPNKLSYSISKAACGAIVRSSASDLAARNILVNAVLPGVLDTKMTRAVLDNDQLVRVQNVTGFNRLVVPQEVAEVVGFLCSPSNTAITGQSIVVDLGYTNVRSF